MHQPALRILLLLFLIAGISIAILNREAVDIDSIQTWVEQSGVLAPFIFMAFYALASVFFLPGSILTLAGGALFGPTWGVLYNLSGATIGALLAFLIARYIASDWVTKKSGRRLKQLINGVENEGWRFVAFTRLVPVFPFNLLNYALGLTKIKLLDYALATFLFMLPGAVAYTYLGYIGHEAASGGESLVQKIMLGLALLAIALFLPKFISRMRSQNMINITDLKQRMDKGEDILLLDVRTAEDYEGEQGHIAGSILIPLEQLEQRLDELGDNQDKTIITICRTDRKSGKATHILTENNFNNTYTARMGMTDWIKQGYPTE